MSMKNLIFVLALLPAFTQANQCVNLFEKSKELFTTVNYYNANAEEYNRTRAHTTDELELQRQTFTKNLPQGGAILEIGAGHGRDALYFKNQGFKVIATEPSD